MGLADRRRKVMFKRKCLPGKDALQLCPVCVEVALCIHHPCLPVGAMVFVEINLSTKAGVLQD